MKKLDVNSAKSHREIRSEGGNLHFYETGALSPGSSTSPGGLAERSDYVAAMASLLSPGSRLIGVFYLTPDAETGPLHAATREEVPHRSYPTRVGVEWLVDLLRSH